jgi:PAS domain S-box-containing protein
MGKPYANNENEDRYYAMFNQSVDSLVVMNQKGHLEEFNTAAHENLGYTRKEFEKIKLSDIEACESQHDIEVHIAKIVQFGSDHFATKHRTKQGELLDVVVISKAIHTPEGQLLVSTWCDITKEKQAQEALLRKNIAMQELLAGIEEQKNEIGRMVTSNVDKIIMPLLRLVEDGTSPSQCKYINLLRDSLKEIISPFTARLSNKASSLTTAEVRICELIRRGLSTKEIAQMEHVSPATVNKHRGHIRNKLGIINEKVNLAAHLQGLLTEKP